MSSFAHHPFTVLEPASQIGPVKRGRKQARDPKVTHPYAREGGKTPRVVKDANAPSRLDLRKYLRWHRRFRYHVFNKRHDDVEYDKRAHCTNCLHVMSEREVAGSISSDVNCFAITCTKCATQFSGWITVTMGNFPLHHLRSGVCPPEPAVKRTVREHAPWMWEHHIIHFFKRWYIRFYAQQPTVDLLSATWPSLFWNVLNFYPEDAMLAWHTILGKTLPDINAYIRANPQVVRLQPKEDRFVEINSKSKNYDETQVEEFEPVSHDRAMLLRERNDDVTGSASRIQSVKLHLPPEGDSLDYDTLICYEPPKYPWGDPKAAVTKKNEQEHVPPSSTPTATATVATVPLSTSVGGDFGSMLLSPLGTGGNEFGLLNSSFGQGLHSFAFMPPPSRT